MLLTGSQLGDALGWRFNTPEYMLFFEVKVPIGFAPVPHSQADAIVVGRWAKTNHTVHGFEFKSFRQDWLRELARPQKAETIKQFCDYWWLVVGGEGIAYPEELPAGWGMLAPTAFGDLVVAKPAPLLVPIDRRPLMASLLSKLSTSMETNRPTARQDACAGCGRHTKCYVLHSRPVCISCRKKTPWRLS